MPITLEPYNEARDIYIYRFESNWTWDEIYDAFEQFKMMIEGSQHRIDSILDFRQSIHIPNGTITHLKSMSTNRPEQMELAVFISDNRFARMILEIASRLSNTIREKYKVVSTLEDAVALIAASRAEDASV